MTYKIESIRNHIIFTFIEDVTQTRFVNSAESGLIISSLDGNQTLYPRWGKVISVGPDTAEIKYDDYILVEPGKWTTAFYVDKDTRIWKTDEDHVIAVSDAPGSTY